MARSGLATRLFEAGALFVVVFGVLTACRGGASEAVRAAARDQNPNLTCAQDEVREYFCDDLLPLTSSRPAPAPYDNCPATTDILHSEYPPIGRVAGFDEAFTDYTRKRVPPGHSCCYGWCAKVKVADPSLAAPPTCRDSYSLHWGFCMRELEGGTSAPASSPFDRCPAAVTPPEVVAFAPPASALLDLSETAKQRREKQLADCCYGWCSRMPAGTVAKPAQPKTK